MKFFENLLKKLAKFQYEKQHIILLVVLAITIFMAIGIPKISMEGDMMKSMPQGLPIFILNDKVSDTFGGQDVIIVMFGLEEEQKYDYVANNIYDEKIINYVSTLHEKLEEESEITEVISVGTIFNSVKSKNNIDKLSQDLIDSISDSTPAMSKFISRDNKHTFMIVKADVGASEEKVEDITEKIMEKANSLAVPADLGIRITGEPPMRVLMVQILTRDAVYTIMLALIMIFVLLLIMERSFVKAVLISIPLLIGLVWTVGTMGWIGLEITMATAGLGAMILGLGVEYGVFILTRYLEERHTGRSQFESLQISLPSVGSSILGSGLTTIIGFASLTLSITPMMQKLGLSLALGIFYCLISSIVVAPAVVMYVENLEERIKSQVDKKIGKDSL